MKDLDALERWLQRTPTLDRSAWRDRGEGPEGDRGTHLPIRLVERHVAEARASFVNAYRRVLFDEITAAGMNALRIEDLVSSIASAYPSLLPSADELALDACLPLPQKVGHELSVGLVVSALLADPHIGSALERWMRLPHPESQQRLAEYACAGILDMSLVHMRREAGVTYIEMRTGQALNAEDNELNTTLEIAADIALLDPQTRVIVLRGGSVQNARYKGRRVFCSGVNLTKLYNGQIPLLFYIVREMGFVAKILRGLHSGREAAGASACASTEACWEKPWIAAVDTHAIGGGLQLLLVCDHVIADNGAFLSVPARAEGFIPGLANLRLPHYVGRRLANRLVYLNERIPVISDSGALLVDSIVTPDAMDAAISDAVGEMMQLGTQGLVCNRRAFRQAMETPAQFVDYMAFLAREQALCMYGVEVGNNLLRMWIQRSVSTGSIEPRVSS
ncbi:enoyl-CoA hydratase/isomerase family protein [Stenotrophomonas maltophilia]|nr:enoyl-CoA hydratase/isomerase family protein [Stenotrophomonas maltophilia]